MSLFRPCIDLHAGKVKQIVGGSLSDSESDLQTNFISEHDPAFYAKLYCRDGLTGGHVIKLGSGNDEAAKQALQAWPGGLQLGGGITADNATEWLDAGAAQVIATSYIFSSGELQPDKLEKLYRKVGREHLVLDLSCRRLPDGSYRIVTDRWQKFTSLPVNEITLKRLADYSLEFLVHAVDVEGKQSGIDAVLLGILAEYSPIPCVYAGGIRNFDDIERICQVGQGKIAFTVGSALDIFGGTLSYKKVVQYATSFSHHAKK